MSVEAANVRDRTAPMPIWVRAAAGVIRRLPAGRYRAMNWVASRRCAPFWATLPPELGALQFRCDLRDGLMREVCLTGRYEPQETALLRRLLRPGMTFVDVGANWGYFTLVGAHLVGPRGRVLSVEADPDACQALRANLQRNAIDSAAVVEVAADDRTAMLTFQRYEAAAGASGNYGVAQAVPGADSASTINVQARALDDVLDESGIDRVDVLKMDIEGGEAHAIPGLRRRLASRRIGHILLELHPFHLRDQRSSVAEVVGTLRGFGYEPWRIDHSPAAHRAATLAPVDTASLLSPLVGDGADLGNWPHLLWTCGHPL